LSCRFGKDYPKHIHSRDSAYPVFTTNQAAQTHCGAVVSGPWTASPGSTDLFTDDRRKYTASEAGVDYSGSVLCALAGYAALPEGALDACTTVARSPFDGR
jgi:Glycosyl hydrolase family 9